jgi:hypothetical protein
LASLAPLLLQKMGKVENYGKAQNLR